MKKEHKLIILTGLVIGFFGALLVKFGNPGNMGFCIACFLRDITGALKLHSAGPVQYLRPEIMGLVLGAFIAAIKFKEFKTQGGVQTMLLLLFGAFMMIGALVFLGCPLRGLLRLAGGDLNAISGILGFIVGVVFGGIYIKKGFRLGKEYKAEIQTGGYIFPILMIGLIVFLLIKPSFIAFSQGGPGAMAAPILLSIVAGLIVGFLAQRSGFCFAGGYRRLFFTKDSSLFFGYLAVLVSAFIFNIIFGQFKLGFAGQPAAHGDQLWSFLGMALVGLAATFAGGCPLRQLIKSAEGNMSAITTVFGMIFGAAISHNFGLASTGKGTSTNGQIAVVVGLVSVIIIGYFFTETYRSKKELNRNETVEV